MYKYIICIFTILFFCTQAYAAKPINELYGGVSDGQTIFYSYFTNKWYYQSPKYFKNRLLEVTRQVISDDEYSSYVSTNGQVYAPAGSNYEFLYKGRLITYHNYDVKFYEIVYNKSNKAFIEVPLDEKEIRKIFGKPKLIHISDFDEENRIVVHKLPLKKQWFLLINDTDKYFYRYFITTNEKDTNIKTLFSVKKPTTVIYSHYIQDRDEFLPYIIRIKNGF